MKKCENCGRYYSGHGNNGIPLVRGRVCDTCNIEVIQRRLEEVFS